MIDEDDAEDVAEKRSGEHIEEFLNTHMYTRRTKPKSVRCACARWYYSIGAEAFLTSDVYHALNQGQVIEAANGFRCLAAERDCR